MPGRVSPSVCWSMDSWVKQLVSQVNGGGLVGTLLDLFIVSILEGVASQDS